MSDQLSDLALDLRERALTYQFLARALSDDEVPVAFLEALREDPPQTGTELDAFAAGLAGLDDDALEECRRQLAADHSACLLGMSLNPVSPFESVHTSEKQLMMQEARDEVLAAYRRSGFAKDEGYHVPEDHISLELDFAAALGLRAAAAVERALAGEVPAEGEDGPLEEAERDVNAQVDFIEKHLLVWVPGFCGILEKRAATPFYRGVAQMLAAFLEEERAYIAELG